SGAVARAGGCSGHSRATSLSSDMTRLALTIRRASRARCLRLPRSSGPPSTTSIGPKTRYSTGPSLSHASVDLGSIEHPSSWGSLVPALETGEDSGRRTGLEAERIGQDAPKHANRQLSVGHRGFDAAAVSIRKVDLPLVAAVLPLVDDEVAGPGTPEVGPEPEARRRARPELDGHVLGHDRGQRGDDHEGATGLVDVDGNLLRPHDRFRRGSGVDHFLATWLLTRHSPKRYRRVCR